MERFVVRHWRALPWGATVRLWLPWGTEVRVVRTGLVSYWHGRREGRVVPACDCAQSQCPLAACATPLPHDRWEDGLPLALSTVRGRPLLVRRGTAAAL